MTRRVLRSLALVVIAATACGRGRPAANAPSTEAVPPHDAFAVRSAVLGEERPVNVHVPPGYADARDRAATRYPVLYMPDGGVDEDFPHVVRTVDSLIAVRAIRPFIVVGIPNTERRRDLTGPTRVATDSAVAPRVGGSAAFRRFIADELIPTIDARYRTTPERGIIGESLAGLFVVETMLREPRLFTEYVAFDPSLWWNRAALVDSVPAMLAGTSWNATPGAGVRRLFIASSRDDVGGQTGRFVDALVVASPAQLSWAYEPRHDLTHGTIFRALEASGLAWALRQ
jgi:predicted alpha/beta superfamily hydrolase